MSLILTIKVIQSQIVVGLMMVSLILLAYKSLQNQSTYAAIVSLKLLIKLYKQQFILKVK